MAEVCYLLHLDRPLRHSKHYLGTAKDLQKRLAKHAQGKGARMLEVCKERGIGFKLVRTWEGGRTLERKLKRRKEGPRLCPCCRAEMKRLHGRLRLKREAVPV